MRARFGWLFGAGALLVSQFAFAADGGLVAPPPGAPAAPGASATKGDGGAPHGPAETTDQKQYRLRYVNDTATKEHALLKGLVWTPEVTKAVNNHWRRAYRTLRIRELAEDNNDPATVARTDTYLRKIDGHFFALISELAPTLPTIPAAPSITAPAEGTSIAIGSAVTITQAPAAGVTPTQYYCVLYDPHHALVNYDTTKKSYDTTPTCTFAASDPRWSKLAAGPAHIAVRTITKAKSPKGVDYNQWSEAKWIKIALTGGSAPAPAPVASGGAK
jgi:hypothetical protein